MFELMIESFGKKVGSRKRNSTIHLSSFIMNENCNHQILKKNFGKFILEAKQPAHFSPLCCFTLNQALFQLGLKCKFQIKGICMTRDTRSYRSETMRTISVYQFPNDLCGIKLTI